MDRAPRLGLAAGLLLLAFGSAALIASLADPAGERSPVLLGALAMSALLTLLAFAVALGLGGEAPLVRLGLGRGRLRGRVVGLLALGVLALSLAVNAALEEGGLRDRGMLPSFDRVVAGTRGSSLLASGVALGLAPAIGEELFFRGLVQRGLELRIGPGLAIPVAAALFAAIHGDAAHAAAAFVLGLYLGAVAFLSGGVRAAILCHATNNLAAVALGAYGPGPVRLGVVASLALVGVASVPLVVAWWTLRDG